MSAITAEQCMLRPFVPADEVAAYVVAAAIWAPSVHNTQPWWFAVRGAELALHADSRRQLGVADPAGREMMISCGAALFTAKLALRSLGYIPETRILADTDDPLVVARLRWRHRAPPSAYELALYRRITQRRSHRGGFGPQPLPRGLLEDLRQEARQEGARLRLASDDGSRVAVAAVVATAESVQRNESEYVQELAAWTPPPGSLRRDGVAPIAYPARPERTFPEFPSRDFAHGHAWGLPGTGVPVSSHHTGVVCLLTTPSDSSADWVHAGLALQRVLLTATAGGVAAALHSQPVEVDWLREVLRTQLGDGSYPQLVLRLGIVPQIEMSIRRAPESVLFLTGLEPATGESGAAALAGG